MHIGSGLTILIQIDAATEISLRRIPFDLFNGIKYMFSLVISSNYRVIMLQANSLTVQGKRVKQHHIVRANGLSSMMSYKSYKFHRSNATLLTFADIQVPLACCIKPEKSLTGCPAQATPTNSYVNTGCVPIIRKTVSEKSTTIVLCSLITLACQVGPS